MSFPYLLDALCIHIEAGALLHRRVFEKGLDVIADLLLREYEAPELVVKPVVVSERVLGLEATLTKAIANRLFVANTIQDNSRLTIQVRMDFPVSRPWPSSMDC